MSTNLNGNGKLAWGLREAAEACCVSVPYLRKKIESEEIRPLRVGRRILIADSELKRWLGLDSDGQTEGAQSAAA